MTGFHLPAVESDVLLIDVGLLLYLRDRKLRLTLRTQKKIDEFLFEGMLEQIFFHKWSVKNFNHVGMLFSEFVS